MNFRRKVLFTAQPVILLESLDVLLLVYNSGFINILLPLPPTEHDKRPADDRLLRYLHDEVFIVLAVSSMEQIQSVSQLQLLSHVFLDPVHEQTEEVLHHVSVDPSPWEDALQMVSLGRTLMFFFLLLVPAF